MAGNHGNAIVVLGANYFMFQDAQFQRMLKRKKMKKNRNIKENKMLNRLHCIIQLLLRFREMCNTREFQQTLV